MIRSGDTIHNPVTGERITFHQTSADTNGEAVVIECTVQPHGFVAAAHVHPFQTERFAVVDGRLGMKVGREKLVLERGDVTVVEPGKAHRFWNSGDDEVRFVCEIRPARQFESLLETMFVLATEGKTNKKGMPNPLRLAVIARTHFDTVRLPQPPSWLQRAGLALGARTSRGRARLHSRRSNDEAALLLHPPRAGVAGAGGPRLRGEGGEPPQGGR